MEKACPRLRKEFRISAYIYTFTHIHLTKLHLFLSGVP
jgi:hypothetical protein